MNSELAALRPPISTKNSHVYQIENFAASGKNVYRVRCPSIVERTRADNLDSIIQMKKQFQAF